MSLLPGKADEVRKLWDELSMARAHEMDEYARGAGQSRLLVYLQHLPQGDFLVQYVRSDADIKVSFQRTMDQRTPFAKYLQHALMDLTGYDFTLPENAPNVDQVYEWTAREDPGEGQRKYYVFAYPLRTGKVDAFLRHYDTRRANARHAEDLFRDQGVLRVQEFLQELQHRPGEVYTVNYLETHDDLRKVLGRVSDEVRNFWLDITNVDLASPQGVPNLELLFDWNAERGIQTAEAQKAYTI
ncbi:MAG TPA: hypothetical protein VK436_04350 [Methanocella sp.]|nr:hypothetical protein [Methanocella sp.]